MRSHRPIIPALGLTVMAALYVLALTNRTFWSKAVAYFDGHALRLVSFAAILLLLHVAVLALFSGRRLLRPVLILLVLLAAASSYFSDRFGVVIDRNMIANVVETTGSEASQLLTLDFFIYMLLFGVLPAGLLAWVQVTPASFRQRLAISALSLAAAALLIGAQASYFLPMWRQERTGMMSHLVPATPIVGAISFGVRQFNETGVVAHPYGADARTGAALAAADRKVLTLVIVGETARAENFSLLGYGRDTNAETATRDVIAFSNVTSCGTATAVSLPCMFSHLGRAGYSNAKALGSENLEDVLAHAGLHVEWWDNNSGSKTVAKRVREIDFYKAKDDRFCQPEGGDCNDDILVDLLRKRIGDISGNAVLVLHLGGSHGPAYYLRYPRAFARFQPDCQTAQISDCSREELINAYDNSLVFTDHVLAEIIDLLKAKQDQFASSLVYMSDHGESLGENGVYLHGAPYMIAPSQQTHIPMLAWFSPDFARINGLDTACVRREKDKPLSHDNLFSTVLGLMDVHTRVYARGQDAFASCRRPAS